MTVKIGLIGVGRWGKILKKKIKKIDGAQLVWSGGKSFDYETRLGDVDWVFVATPNKTHFDIVKKCLNAGKHVFCEKPLGLSEKRSKTLFNLAKKKGRCLYVDDVFIFRNEYRLLKEKLRRADKHESMLWKRGVKSDFKFDLMYHHMYMLYEKFKDDEIQIAEFNRDVADYNNNKEKFGVSVCYFMTQFQVVKLTYIEQTKYEPKHWACGYDLRHKEITNDALEKMIKKVITLTDVDEENKNRALFANRMLDKLKKKR